MVDGVEEDTLGAVVEERSANEELEGKAQQEQSSHFILNKVVQASLGVVHLQACYGHCTHHPHHSINEGRQGERES